MDKDDPDYPKFLDFNFGGIEISYMQLQRMNALITSYSESPPRRIPSTRWKPPSQPPSPRKTSSPQRPTLTSQKALQARYNIYTILNNYLLTEEVEKILGITFADRHLSGIAQGRDLDMENLVLQAINKLSVMRIRRLAFWMVKQEVLIKKVFERELDVENVDEGVIEKVLLMKLMELVVAIVRRNATVRKWMVNLLLDKKEDDTFEFTKYND